MRHGASTGVVEALAHLGFVVRLDYGGVAFEDDQPDTLAEAMAALDQGLTKWFKQQGIEVQ